MTLEAIAAELGLGSKTLYVLRGRHGDFPMPAVRVLGVRGRVVEGYRLGEVRRWYEERQR